MENEKLIIEAYQKMCQAMISKDTAELNQVLDDSFVLVHLTGMRQSKAEFIQCIQNGQLQYFSAETERLQVIKHTTDSAALLGQSRVQAAVFGRGKLSWNLQLTLKLRLDKKCWKIVEAIASTY